MAHRLLTPAYDLVEISQELDLRNGIVHNFEGRILQKCNLITCSKV